MIDPRIADYARLLVDRCVGVQPGWQVLLISSPLSRPLFEEVSRLIGERGAYVLPRLGFSGVGAAGLAWIQAAPEELLAEAAPLERHVIEHVNALIQIAAPENTREASGVDPHRLSLLQRAWRPALQRLTRGDLPWVGCQYPVPALAQDAGMHLSAFEDFLYGACLLDWDAEEQRMRRYADRFDAADEVRFVADGTDLTISLAGRKALVDAGGANVPGGEFFFSPVEDSAAGTVTFSEFPGVFAGRDIPGIRLRFEGGRVVDATANDNQEFLLSVLDTDEGARRLGELGIGCNPGITRYMRNTLFDEKIDGTFHLALGNGFPQLGGSNVSAIHWDIVKDLRGGGEIYLDGELVQENGEWKV